MTTTLSTKSSWLNGNEPVCPRHVDLTAQLSTLKGMRQQQPPSFIKYYKAYQQLKEAKDILERDHHFDRRIVSHLNDALAILFEQGNFEDGTLWDQ